MVCMKTTIDIDEAKIKRVMKMTGLTTRKAVVDYALAEAEKSAKMNLFFRESLYGEEDGEIVDPEYDILSLREKEKPTSYPKKRKK